MTTATATKKQTLNDLIEKFHEIEFMLIEAGGALDEEIEKLITSNEKAIEKKLDGYAGVIEYLKGQADYLGGQAKLFTARKRTIQNSIESMRERMVYAMQETKNTKIKTAAHSYSIRETESWKMRDDVSKEMEDELVADGLGVYEFKPDMTAIKDEYKGSEPPAFIDVMLKTSITIR